MIKELKKTETMESKLRNLMLFTGASIEITSEVARQQGRSKVSEIFNTLGMEFNREYKIS